MAEKRKKFFIVFNRKKEKNQEILNSLIKSLDKHDFEYALAESRYAYHLMEILKSLDVAKWDAILALGGDGTLHEVINCLITEDGHVPIPVGLIPTGTGNDFLRSFGSTDPNYWIQKVLSGQLGAIDLIKIDTGQDTIFCHQNFGWGLFYDGLVTALKFKSLGSFCYSLGAVISLFKTKIKHALMTSLAQTHKWEGNFWGVLICNVCFGGGGMPLAPDAKADDGKLNVVVIKSSSRFILVFQSLYYLITGRYNLKFVDYLEVTEFELKTGNPTEMIQIDGEPHTSSGFKASVLKGALQFFH